MVSADLVVAGQLDLRLMSEVLILSRSGRGRSAGEVVQYGAGTLGTSVCTWARPLYSLMIDLWSDMTRPAEVGMEPGDGSSHRGYH